MTQGTKYAPRRAGIPAAALAALLLAGCSSGYIGETWQCPLAEGGSCDSVAAADPAVPAATGGTVLAEPLWRVRGAGSSSPAETSCAAECDGGFDPFGWLMRLFGVEAEESEAHSAGGAAQAAPVTAAPPPHAGSGAGAALPAAARTAEPAAAALPGEPAAGETHPVQDDPHDDDLRTGEVVARIWIAPFVDADGVYREASHVRVVLEPAGWRLK